MGGHCGSLTETADQRLVSQMCRALAEDLCPKDLSAAQKCLGEGQGPSFAALLPSGCERLTPGWIRIFPPSVVVAMIPSL